MKRSASTSTLARLSFWVSPERLAEFERAHEQRLAPILKKHGLVESAERGRPTAEGIFSRLFAVENPSAVTEMERAFHQDLAWQEALRNLGISFGTADPGGLLRHRFGIYRTPAGPGKTAEAGPGFRQGAWQMFGVEDGLPSSVVIHMARDREGNLWLATEAGVCRYDGAEFTSFTAADGLPDKTVLAVLQDRDGNLWFGTWEGVWRYDGTRFEAFGVEDGLPHDVGVGSILQDRQGNLWFSGGGGYGEGKGLCRYDGQQFFTFTPAEGLIDKSVYALLEDREGNLWVGTQGGLCRYDGVQFKTFTIEDGLPDNNVPCLLEDRGGTLWCGTGSMGNRGGVSRYDGRRFNPLPLSEGLAAYAPETMLEDREGTLWIGSGLGGVWRYDGRQFQAFTTADGLPHDWVHALLEDGEGNLWVGTHGGGLCRFDGQRIRNFTTAEGLGHNTLHSIVIDHTGHLWLGTAGGVSQYDGAQFKTFTTENGLADDFVRPVLEDRRGNIWIGTGTFTAGGLCRYDRDQWRSGPRALANLRFRTFTTADGLAENAVMSLLEDREGILWIGHWGGGVSRYDGRSFITFTQKDGLPATPVRSLLEDREGNLWVGTQGGGLCRYDGQGFKPFTTKDGLVASAVMALLEDREGVLWIGTRGGLCRCDRQGFRTLTQEDGLADNHLRCILEDREGHLWFGTFGAGVSLYDGLVFQRLSRQDGLVSNTVNQVCQHPDGTIWIATEAGLTHYRPGKNPPRVRLKDVVADQRYGPVAELHLPESQRFIRFEFQGRSFTTRPDRMVHVCRLLGHEEEWKPCYGRQMEYRDLPLGEYTFQVRAVDRDLIYSDLAEVHLKVVPDPRDQRIDELEQRVRERTRELEEKNRALVVETALERVRAAVAAMRESQDLFRVVKAVKECLQGLGVRCEMVGINIIDEEASLIFRQIQDAEGINISSRGRLHLGPTAELYSRWKAGQTWQRRWTEAYLRKFALEYLQDGVFKTEEEIDQLLKSWGNRWVVDAPFPHGTLAMNKLAPDPFSEEEVHLLERFTQVFSLAYTRFLDLQEAEARARQAQRQAAVDRLRAEIASMRTSADLERVTPLLWRELTGLGVPFLRCGVFIMNPEARLVRAYLSNPQGGALGGLQLGFGSHPLIQRVVERWQTREVHTEQWDQETFLQYMGFLQDQGQIEPQRFIDAGVPAAGLTLQFIPFTHGMLYVGSASPLSEEDIALVKDLADAFSVAYARYQDFQRLEEANSALSDANKELFRTLQEKEKAQELLVRSESMAAIGTLVAGVAHELNNPLGAAYSLTQTVQEMIEEDTPEQLQQEKVEIVEHLAFSRKELNRAKEIVASLLGLARQNQDYTEAVELNTVVQDALRVLYNQYKKYDLNLVEEYGEGLPAVQGNFAQLGQVCMNLIKNAIEALKGQEGQIVLKTYREGEQVVFECADTGPGIPAEVRANIFNPFFTTKAPGEGTGLGLYICHQTVEKHHGEIGVESEVGKGTVFRVRLPAGRGELG